MSSLLNFGAGYRTYAIVVIFIICVAAEKFFGLDIPGFDVGNDWFEQVLAMLGLGTLRAGIAANK